jgi:ABC-type transporter Mla subunit MlaD
MGDQGVPDLQVDLDGLTAFAARLDRIRSALESARETLRGYDDALGDPRVVRELERFEDRWRDGREKIEANAETLSTMVTESVRTYREADDELASALTTTAS